MTVLVWKQYSSEGWYATTESGQYLTKENFLWFEPSNGNTVDPCAEGKEYLGHYPNPREAAQQHADSLGEYYGS